MNNLNKKSKKAKAVLGGMTLIEALVTIFVFGIIVLASAAVSAAYFKSRTSIAKQQQSVEEMSIAINSMAKKLRMSNCNDFSCAFTISRIEVERNIGGTLEYRFSDGTLSEIINGNNTNTVLDDVGVRFHTINRNGIPRITITIWDRDLPGSVVQTTISMRSGYEVD